MYEFTEDCMLHIDAIDEEHKRLFQMINEAFELVEKTEDVTAIGQSLIANLKDYAATHRKTFPLKSFQKYFRSALKAMNHLSNGKTI